VHKLYTLVSHVNVASFKGLQTENVETTTDWVGWPDFSFYECSIKFRLTKVPVFFSFVEDGRQADRRYDFKNIFAEKMAYHLGKCLRRKKIVSFEMLLVNAQNWLKYCFLRKAQVFSAKIIVARA
jgi:hypothetical protein